MNFRILSLLRLSKKTFFLNYSSKAQTNFKMSSWEKEKKEFLSMPLEAKRKVYKCNKPVLLDDVPTWAEYAEMQSSLPEKIPLLTTNQIDNAQNTQLAKKISMFRGDITTLEIDAIVNAANKTLLGGGGVDGAIHRAAGPCLKQECQTLHGCQVGEAKLTGGYMLPAKYVIHTVGPQGEQPGYLAECYKNSLNVMKAQKLRTIAFPCISTGIYGYPLKPAAHVASMEVRKHLESNSDSVDRVIFCLFSEEDEILYKQILQSYFPLK
ncbi:hypothetical protein PPYR_11305 [Photinus pyralis]|uniref:Macro domain-containing protein n=1 Tax=Photinus pyralis TaxID=7054 RepID=A0A1Y1MS46_PHOPY|nr:uncharacterized protein LOC116176329 [Photinus pyralis]KAB0794466.1 hypothetical protein PPYR_11305 [Photinus pyralis]